MGGQLIAQIVGRVASILARRVIIRRLSGSQRDRVRGSQVFLKELRSQPGLAHPFRRDD